MCGIIIDIAKMAAQRLRTAIMSCTLIVLIASYATAAPGDLLFTIKAPDPQPGASFSYTLATVDGDILVGAITADLGLPIDAQGRAHLFDGETGKHAHTFDLPEPMAGDLFASSLAGGDGRVFISARGVIPRVYAFDANTGQLVHTMRDPDGEGGNFAAEVAYGNGSVLVSSPAFSIPFGAQSIGRAYLFDSISGELARPLPNPEPKPADGFGLGPSLAVFGNRAVVGAKLDDLPGDDRPDGDNPGRVWVFDRLTGETIFTLENPNPEGLPPHFFSDSFGRSVAANENVIVVGAGEEDTGSLNDSGAAYVFDSNTGALLHTLFSPDLEQGARFGGSVAVTPNGNILIGSSLASVNGFPSAGHVYLFDSLTGGLLLDIPNPDPVRFPGFAFSATATDERIFVGSPSDGAVLVFETIPEPSTMLLLGALFIAAAAMYRMRRLQKAAVGPRCVVAGGAVSPVA